ncbi:hypothetical protein Sar04_34320 [Salinispora arenicola]|uniref:Uncharacterized protein n=1 Tax=Salinispora arenicola TaxID=168697 RepID=A0ABQ4JX31_SALAC|nr:hypothetical protein Sar04_34320 [Salinispora arenicola]
MWWPARARRRAVAAPIPRLPPVMTVTGFNGLPRSGWCVARLPLGVTGVADLGWGAADIKYCCRTGVRKRV